MFCEQDVAEMLEDESGRPDVAGARSVVANLEAFGLSGSARARILKRAREIIQGADSSA